MIKKGAILFVLSVFLILIGGCETIKGALKGATEGAKRDWESAKKIDSWIRENLW